MKKELIFFGLFALFGCHSTHTSEEVKVVEVDEVAKEIHIPVGVWDQVEGKTSLAAEHGEEKSQKAEAENSTDTGGGGVLFMPVDVILKEKTPGVLVHPSIKIRFPRGGGAVDLSQYVVADKQGSFYVSFEWPEAEESVQAWYVSKAHRRRLGAELWGDGCGKAFRMGSAFTKAVGGGGVKVNTTKNRHLTMLGGHFVFATHKARQIFSAQVTFKDTQHPEYFCEDL